MANQITSLRDSRCSRVNAWHCCLVGLSSPSFVIDTVAIRMLRKTGVELQYGWLGLHHGMIGPRLHRRAPIAPSGPDHGEIALSLVACFRKLQGGGILSNTGGKDGAFREDSGRVWCCWGYRPSFFFLLGGQFWNSTTIFFGFFSLDPVSINRN